MHISSNLYLVVGAIAEPSIKYGVSRSINQLSVCREKFRGRLWRLPRADEFGSHRNSSDFSVKTQDSLFINEPTTENVNLRVTVRYSCGVAVTISAAQEHNRPATYRRQERSPKGVLLLEVQSLLQPLLQIPLFLPPLASRLLLLLLLVEILPHYLLVSMFLAPNFLSLRRRLPPVSQGRDPQ